MGLRDDEEVDIRCRMKGVEGNRVTKVDFFDEGNGFVDFFVVFDDVEVVLHEAGFLVPGK